MSANEEIASLLDAAATLMDETPLCWITIRDGGVHARPMGFDGKDFAAWRLSFVTDGRSDKAAALREAGRATVLMQRGADDFVAASGTAWLSGAPEEIARRWKRGYNAFFPTEVDRANAIFVDLTLDSLDLWIRGVTPEPFGQATTKLTRENGGAWRLASG